MSVAIPKGARIGRSPRIKHNARFEELLAFQMKSLGLPTPEREYRFAISMKREWRFDFCFLPYSLAVEFEGLVVRKERGRAVVSGRHATITGMREDMVKYNAAILLGYGVLRFEKAHVVSGQAVATIQQALSVRGWRKEGAAQAPPKPFPVSRIIAVSIPGVTS